MDFEATDVARLAIRASCLMWLSHVFLRRKWHLQLPGILAHASEVLSRGSNSVLSLPDHEVLREIQTALVRQSVPLLEVAAAAYVASRVLSPNDIDVPSTTMIFAFQLCCAAVSSDLYRVAPSRLETVGIVAETFLGGARVAGYLGGLHELGMMTKAAHLLSHSFTMLCCFQSPAAHIAGNVGMFLIEVLGYGFSIGNFRLEAVACELVTLLCLCAVHVCVYLIFMRLHNTASLVSAQKGILKSLCDVHLTVDEDFCLEECSPELASLLCYDQRDIKFSKGASFLELVSEPDRQRFHNFIKQAPRSAVAREQSRRLLAMSLHLDLQNASGTMKNAQIWHTIIRRDGDTWAHLLGIAESEPRTPSDCTMPVEVPIEQQVHHRSRSEVGEEFCIHGLCFGLQVDLSAEHFEAAATKLSALVTLLDSDTSCTEFNTSAISLTSWTSREDGKEVLSWLDEQTKRHRAHLPAEPLEKHIPLHHPTLPDVHLSADSAKIIWLDQVGDKLTAAVEMPVRAVCENRGQDPCQHSASCVIRPEEDAMSNRGSMCTEKTRRTDKSILHQRVHTAQQAVQNLSSELTMLVQNKRDLAAQTLLKKERQHIKPAITMLQDKPELQRTRTSGRTDNDEGSESSFSLSQ